VRFATPLKPKNRGVSNARFVPEPKVSASLGELAGLFFPLRRTDLHRFRRRQVGSPLRHGFEQLVTFAQAAHADVFGTEAVFMRF